MPSLKDRIQSLFKLSGSQAMPSSSYIDVGTPTSDTVLSYVAPSDGYFVARVVSGTSVTTCQLESDTPGVWICHDSLSTSTAFWGDFIPVRKGATAKAMLRFSSFGSASRIMFVPLVGQA